jgi:hypothetical protein
LQKIKKLEPSLSFNRAPSSVSTEPRAHVKEGISKLRWAILLEQDVAKLKANIGPGIEIINTLLQIESLERVTVTNKCVDQILDQTGKVMPVVDKIATFLHSNIATEKQFRDVLPLLSNFRRKLSRTATARQIKSLTSALADLSVRFDKSETKNQANDLKRLAEAIRAEQSNGTAILSMLAGSSMQDLIELKKTAESSNLMLATLIDRTPHVSGRVVQGPTTTTSNDSNQSRGPSKTNLSRQISPIIAWQGLLEALRHALNAIVLLFFWLNPAFQLCLKSMKMIPQSPSMHLGSNITFVDALNRESSLQYQHFRYWPVMSAFIKCQFRDCPGALRIAHDRFAVFKDMRITGRGVMIPFDDWEQTVRPGQRILMSMHIGKQHSTRDHWQPRNVCPSCGFAMSHPVNSQIWKRWQVK